MVLAASMEKNETNTRTNKAYSLVTHNIGTFSGSRSQCGSEEVEINVPITLTVFRDNVWPAKELSMEKRETNIRTNKAYS